MADSWYEAVDASTPLTQGDLIAGCPLVGWAAEPLIVVGSDEEQVLQGATIAVRADVVVMTQACDLENHKVTNVILCQHVSLVQYKESWDAEMRARGQIPTARAWKSLCADIRDGYLWNLAILNSGTIGGLNTEHRIVDFHDVFTVPRTFLESLLLQRGLPRLRLLAPYREHLSQAFARFFMRVGLPTPVSDAW